MDCPKCGLSNTKKDEKRGTLSCLSCGGLTLLGTMKNDIEFEELNTGRHVAVGTKMRANQNTLGGALKDQFAVANVSREMTLYNTKKIIERISRQLGLEREIDVAHNFYKLALQHNLTKGTRIQCTVAACLYIAARLRGTNLMLLDFCDVIGQNITILAKCYIRITMALCLSLEPVDPSMYIPRFVNKLRLGPEDKAKVTRTALRICQRMKRDFMVQGRRPNGLSGAAIFVAARVHDLNVSFDSIARVVKISQAVVRTRIREFEETHAASLTIGGLLNTEDGAEDDQKITEADPPAFQRSRDIDRLLEQKLATITDFNVFEAHMEKMSQEIDEAMKKIVVKTRSGCVRAKIADQMKEEIEGYKSDDDDFEKAKALLNPGSLAFLGEGIDVDEKVEIKKLDDDDDCDELDVDGIEDDEIDEYLLTKEESKEKAKVWLKSNVKWLRKEREKRLAEEEEKAAELLDPFYKPRKKKRKHDRSDKRRKSVIQSKLDFLAELDIRFDDDSEFGAANMVKKNDEADENEASVNRETEVEEMEESQNVVDDGDRKVEESVESEPVHEEPTTFDEPVPEVSASLDEDNEEDDEIGEDPFHFL